MNGRIYSPSIGRMLSPDPITQAPENGQNYNRYSYVFNNPLKYTDPTGYCTKKITYCQLKDFNGRLEEVEVRAPDLSGMNYGVGYSTGGAGLYTVSTPTAAIGDNSSPSSDEAVSTPAPVDCVDEAGGTCNATTTGVHVTAQKENYWNMFSDKWKGYVYQINGAADSAVDYWIERDNPLMGTLAAMLTKDNIGNTLSGISLVSGGGSSYLFFAGKNGAFLAELSLVSGVTADVLNVNIYTWQKLGIEAVSRFTLRFGPADDIGSRIHSGVNQISTTFSGSVIGNDQ